MKIYINDIPFRIISQSKKVPLSSFDVIITEANDNINFKDLRENVLIEHASLRIIDSYLQQLKANTNKKIDSLTFHVDNFKEASAFVKSKYIVIKAAGGIVEKEDKILLIFRFKKWDLPKGKLEQTEKPKYTAIREVEEECNIKVKLKEKVCNSWHTYKRNGKNILKKTYWYRMEIKDDLEMKPQMQENIEDLRWMDVVEVKHALYNSYPSIRNVVRKYYEHKGRL